MDYFIVCCYLHIIVKIDKIHSEACIKKHAKPFPLTIQEYDLSQKGIFELYISFDCSPKNLAVAR